MNRDIYKPFPITYITREDVLRYIPEAFDLTDDQMIEISCKMENRYLENGFWEDLKEVCEETKKQIL